MLQGLKQTLHNTARLISVPYRELRTFYGWKLQFFILGLTAVTLLEGVGLALLLPLLFALGLVQATDAGPLVGTLTQIIHAIGLPQSPIGLGAITLAILVLQTLLSLVLGIEMSRLQTEYNHSVRRRVFGRLLNTQWRTLNQTDISQMLNAMMGEPQKLATTLGYWLQMLTQVLTVSVYLALSLLSSWKLTCFLMALGFIQGLVAQIAVHRARHLGVRLAQATEPYSAWLGQLMYGLKLVKSTGAEEYCEKEFQKISQPLIREELTTSRAPLYLRFFLEIGGIFSLISCLVVAKMAFALDSISTLFIFGIFYRIFPRLTTIQQMLQGISMYLPALDYIRTVENLAMTHQEPHAAHSQKDVVAIDLQTIQVRSATVRYGEVHAIRDASLDIPKNQLIGIVGRSGSGKTTLLDCLMGIITPDQGTIAVNDRPLSQIAPMIWRKTVGYVGQDTIVFNATIRENIAWNLPNVSLEQIRAAARLADADEFIQAFPDQYETKVGDRGSRISGGQRQRIGIARALLRQPHLLLMDEATSSLDPISETEIMKTVQKLKSRVTVVFVTHRISSLKSADLIYLMDQGQIVGKGTYEGLALNSEDFGRLIQRQPLISG